MALTHAAIRVMLRPSVQLLEAHLLFSNHQGPFHLVGFPTSNTNLCFSLPLGGSGICLPCTLSICAFYPFSSLERYPLRVRSFWNRRTKKKRSSNSSGDKIYEYILFRGSDIKDLQVKASAPVQIEPAYNDPAIIQSKFPHPPATPLSLPSLGTVSTTEISSHTAQLGLQRPTFQGNPTPYPTCGNLGPWGSTHPSLTSNCSAPSVPMYWQGCYAPSVGFPLMRPLPGIAMPPMQQTAQFESPNASSSSCPLFPQLSSSLTSTPFFSSIHSCFKPSNAIFTRDIAGLCSKQGFHFSF
ncbi:hypothetical protein HPP92_009713 [Vanilla planifolia]|uniref:Uncharacterized protein n=1 Tax=Vanilla planifolia TaxID=51239 RepID=A0A835V341_VANPL|nr:hypothetical protein HPP92_009713 [Vanilla planifolia]